MRLTREVRFQITAESVEGSKPVNSWAGWPASARVTPYVIVRATVIGRPDTQTGYICSITLIDRLIRERGIPAVNQLWAEARKSEAPGGDVLLRVLWESIRDAAPAGTRWARLECRVTPFLSFTIQAEDWSMVRITQSFEFSAAHRLFCPEFSEEKNREVFGKCAHVNAHGHNYQVEITVTNDPDGVDLAAMERVVIAEVIDRFDHKHLNEDCQEFASLNPSVENITRVIWEKLAGKLAPMRLTQVRVWETPKTYAEYSGPEGQ